VKNKPAQGIFNTASAISLKFAQTKETAMEKIEKKEEKISERDVYNTKGKISEGDVGPI
jgi:hypothetical protein